MYYPCAKNSDYYHKGHNSFSQFIINISVFILPDTESEMPKIIIHGYIKSLYLGYDIIHSEFW